MLFGGSKFCEAIDEDTDEWRKRVRCCVSDKANTLKTSCDLVMGHYNVTLRFSLLRYRQQHILRLLLADRYRLHTT